MVDYSSNLMGEKSVHYKIKETAVEIKKLKERVSQIDSSQELLELEKIITSTGTDTTKAGKEEYTDTQKSIKEDYIAFQKENIKTKDKLLINESEIKNEIKVISKDLSKIETKIHKMKTKIEHVVDKRETFSSIFKNPFRSKKKQDAIQKARENSVKEDAVILDQTAAISMRITRNANLVTLTENKSVIIDKINDLKIKHQQQQEAVNNRFVLAGEFHTAITDIEKRIMLYKKDTKTSSPDLKNYLETSIYPKLEEQKTKLKELEEKLVTTEYNFEKNNGKEVSKEQEFLTSLSKSCDDSEKTISKLHQKAKEACSFRPEKSSFSTEQKTARQSAILTFNTISNIFVKAPTDKELNEQLGAHLKEFNQKINSFASSVLGESATNDSPGKLFGELEVLKSEIAELESKIDPNKVSPGNKSNILKMKDNFSKFSDIENTKFTALKFLYLDNFEEKISHYSKNLIAYHEYMDDPNIIVKKDVEQRKGAIDKERQELKEYIKIMKGLAEKLKIDASESQPTLDYFEKLEGIGKEEQIKAAQEFRESKVTAASLGKDMEQKYQQAFDGVLGNPNKIPRIGLTKSIPLFQMKLLEPMLQSMKRIDKENSDKYEKMLDQLKSLEKSLNSLKDTSSTSSVETMLNELNQVTKSINECIETVEKQEFSLNENNAFFGGTEGKQSFGEKNKDWLLERLKFSSSILEGIKKHGEKIQDKSVQISEIALAPENIEINITNGTVLRDSEYKLEAVFSAGDINEKTRDQFIKEALTYFKNNEGIDQPYVQLSSKKYFYLDSQGNLKTAIPFEVEREGLEFKPRNKVTTKFKWSGQEI